MPPDPRDELEQLYAERLADENAPDPARDARIAELEAALPPVRTWPAQSERRLKPRDATAALPAEVLVPVSTSLLVRLARKDSDPVVIVSLKPRDDDSFEMVLRQPTRAELESALRTRYRG